MMFCRMYERCVPTVNQLKNSPVAKLCREGPSIVDLCRVFCVMRFKYAWVRGTGAGTELSEAEISDSAN